MNKKGITPIIAVVLLLMMTVAAAGAAFYWLTRMQQQAQAGVTGQQQKLIEESSASLSLVSQSFNAANDLLVDIQNTGGRSISLDQPDIIAILEDGDGNSVCRSVNLTSGSTNFICPTAVCTGTLDPNVVDRINVSIHDTDCALTAGITYYYQIKFQKGASVSGSFTA